ncbi:MAG: hypothetical protein DRI57_27790 [Deltaproteobacteria bacterium]|nr:MAG: hypothetical protein DRI57_27790 [Deltaproteobacteria bacterium]
MGMLSIPFFLSGFPAGFTCDPGRFQPDIMQDRGMNAGRNRSSPKSVIIRKICSSAFRLYCGTAKSAIALRC